LEEEDLSKITHTPVSITILVHKFISVNFFDLPKFEKRLKNEKK